MQPTCFSAVSLINLHPVVAASWLRETDGLMADKRQRWKEQATFRCRHGRAPQLSRSVDQPRGQKIRDWHWMESLYALTQEEATKMKEENQVKASQGDDQAPVKQKEQSSEEQEPLVTLMETSTKPNDSSESTPNPADDAFGFAFETLPKEELEDSQPQLDEQWRRDLGEQGADPADKPTEGAKVEAMKTEEGRLAELSEATDSTSMLSIADPIKVEDETAKASQLTQQESTVVAPAAQNEQKTLPSQAPEPRKTAKPAITINTASGSTGVGAKRPPPTPVSPPTFSWNDILRVQSLIERCLQQYLSKNEILLTLKQQANVDPAFSNVVWQKLEEQNPTFFRAYSLQLQLKEQIIAFNYLVGQQKEMAKKGGKRLLHYGGINRASSAIRVPTSCSLSTTPTTTTLPPISMDARTFLRTPIRSAKQQRTPAGRRAFNQQHMNTYQLGATPSGMTTLPPPSPLPLPLPSPIKTDLDTHAFFT